MEEFLKQTRWSSWKHLRRISKEIPRKMSQDFFCWIFFDPAFTICPTSAASYFKRVDSSITIPNILATISLSSAIRNQTNWPDFVAIVPRRYRTVGMTFHLLFIFPAKIRTNKTDRPKPFGNFKHNLSSLWSVWWASRSSRFRPWLCAVDIVLQLLGSILEFP